jgi:transglutaminase-like putative cysteine protease
MISFWSSLLLALPLGIERPLGEQACQLRDHGRSLEAIDLLLDGMASSVATSAYAGEQGAARAETDALVLLWLVRETESWTEVLDRLSPLADRLGSDFPQARFLVSYTRAEGLRCLGRFDEARELVAGLGYFNDFLVVGPFDNERGAGFGQPHEPETRGVDLGEALRGKEREIRWRSNPCPEHPLMRLSLAELFHPSEQVLAYVATAIHCDSDRDLELRLGTSGPCKVWLDGVELLSRNVERTHFPDQDRVVLPLRAGWNQLLLELSVETGQWTLETRLTELSGEPATGWSVDSKQCGPPNSGPRAAVGKSLPQAREILAKATDDATACRLLALHHLIVHPDDRTADSDAAAARRAVELEPDDVLARYLLARSLEPEVESRSEMALAPYVTALQDVLARDAQHVSAMLDLASVSSDSNPLPDRAGELSLRALDLAPGSWRAATLRARYLLGRNRDAEGRAVLERAASLPEGMRRSDAMMLRARMLADRGKLEASVDELSRSAGQRLAITEIVEPLVARLVDLDRADEATALLDRALHAVPFAVDMRLRAARLFEYSGREDVARALVLRAREVSPEGPQVLEQLARLEERAGALEKASALLAEVLSVDPGNDRVRRKRLVLMREAGSEERFETPWRRDPAELVQLPMPEGDANDPIQVLDRTTVWRLYPDGAESRYEHLVIRVLNLAGVQALDRHPIDYPADAHLNVMAVRVLRRDGTTERAPPPRQGDVLRGETAYRVFDLPPVSAGDVVDVEYRVDETEPGVFGQYFGEQHVFFPDLFDPLAPTRRSELVVIAPSTIELYSNERNAPTCERERTTDSAGNTILHWVVEDLRRPPIENAMPRREEFVPQVEVSTYRDWQAFGHWWWSFIEKEFDTTPEMKAKVAELTAGRQTEREKVQAILRFVGQEVHYNSWPFGTHGYEPFRASTIFERRFGDCKDKSILLRQLLAEIGVEAVPVLLRAEYARAEEPLDSARVGHFNHCIAYVTPKGDRPGYYLDATADLDPLDYLRADDQGARVLHVGPEGAEIHEIPYAPAEENALRRTWDVELAADGSARVTMVDESNGQGGVMLRYAYGGQKEAIEDQLAQTLNDPFGKVDFEDVQTSNLEDIGEPARLQARFTCPSLGAAQGGGRILPLAFESLGLEGLAIEAPAERVHDVVLDRPYRVLSTVRWKLGTGLRVAKLPQEATLEVPGLLRYRVSAREEAPDRVLVERDFELLQRRVPLAQYASLHGALEEIRLAEQRTLDVERATGGGR